MANWARTDYRIEGNQKDLQEIYNLCKAFDNSERLVMEDGASKDWEGNIILALGIEKGESYLRGFIQSCELSDGLLCIEAQEAWGATDFRHLLEKHYNGMKVYYIVEEDGCEVYVYGVAELCEHIGVAFKRCWQLYELLVVCGGECSSHGAVFVDMCHAVAVKVESHAQI